VNPSSPLSTSCFCRFAVGSCAAAWIAPPSPAFDCIPAAAFTQFLHECLFAQRTKDHAP
jgi:hypothetical protein